MNWKEMSNSEIEVAVKGLEFEYEKIKLEIYTLSDKLDSLNSEYIKGKEILDRRTNPSKFK